MDVFAKVKQCGFNDVASKKIQQLLAAGGSVEPEKLLSDLLGRRPNQEAFLRAFGLD